MADKTCSVDGCERVEQLRRGYCKPHYRRFMQFRDPLFNKTAPRSLSLWERVEFHGWVEVPGPLPTPCWEFQKGLSSRKGYGCIQMGGKHHTTHRISYERFHGSIPENLLVLHACDNPPCINPDHLRVGTVKENSRDMLDRGRHTPPTGERNGMSIIDEGTVREILDERAGTEKSYSDIGRDFGVSMSLVALIVKGKRWNHVYKVWRKENPKADLRVKGESNEEGIHRVHSRPH